MCVLLSQPHGFQDLLPVEVARTAPMPSRKVSSTPGTPPRRPGHKRHRGAVHGTLDRVTRECRSVVTSTPLPSYLPADRAALRAAVI